MLVGLVAVSMFLLIRVLVKRGVDDRQIMAIGLVCEMLGWVECSLGHAWKGEGGPAGRP
jgi:hypothetical protein